MTTCLDTDSSLAGLDISARVPDEKALLTHNFAQPLIEPLV